MERVKALKCRASRRQNLPKCKWINKRGCLILLSGCSKQRKHKARISKQWQRSSRKMTTKMDTLTSSTRWPTCAPRTTDWRRWIGWRPNWRQAESPQHCPPPRAASRDCRQSNWWSISMTAPWSRWETHSWTWQGLCSSSSSRGLSSRSVSMTN